MNRLQQTFESPRERRDRAFHTLIEVLNSKSFGDTITATEIVEATGDEDWRAYSGRIRRFMLKRGFEVIPVLNDGYRVPSAGECVRARVPAIARAGHRRLAKAAIVSAAVPTELLTDADERMRLFHSARLAKEVELGRRHEEEFKRQLLPPPKEDRRPRVLK